MGFCKGLGKVYLVAANVVTFILGLGVMGAASYALAQFNEKNFDEMFSMVGLGITVACGALVCFVSFAGCYGALKQKKCLLGFYMVCMILTFLVFLAAGIAVGIYNGKIGDITKSEDISQLESTFQQQINDYEMASYEVCCYQAYQAQLSQVQLCSSTVKTGCYLQQDTFDNFADKVIKNDADGAFCKGLQEIKVNGVAIVGNPLTGACGGSTNSAQNFQASIAEFFDDNAKYMIAGSITVAVLQFLCLAFSCALLCANREEYDSEYAAKMEQQRRQAGDMTGTQGVAISSNGTNYV